MKVSMNLRISYKDGYYRWSFWGRGVLIDKFH